MPFRTRGYFATEIHMGVEHRFVLEASKIQDWPGFPEALHVRIHTEARKTYLFGDFVCRRESTRNPERDPVGFPSVPRDAPGEAKENLPGDIHPQAQKEEESYIGRLSPQCSYAVLFQHISLFHGQFAQICRSDFRGDEWCARRPVVASILMGKRLRFDQSVRCFRVHWLCDAEIRYNFV